MTSDSSPWKALSNDIYSNTHLNSRETVPLIAAIFCVQESALRIIQELKDEKEKERREAEDQLLVPEIKVKQ